MDMGQGTWMQRRQNEDEGAVRGIYHYITNKCGSPDFSGRGI